MASVRLIERERSRTQHQLTGGSSEPVRFRPIGQFNYHFIIILPSAIDTLRAPVGSILILAYLFQSLSPPLVRRCRTEWSPPHDRSDHKSTSRSPSLNWIDNSRERVASLFRLSHLCSRQTSNRTQKVRLIITEIGHKTSGSHADVGTDRLVSTRKLSLRAPKRPFRAPSVIADQLRGDPRATRVELRWRRRPRRRRELR